MRTTRTEVDLELVVTSTTLVADRVRSLTLARPDGAQLPAWSPGAHIDLVLGKGLVRQYSLCGDPGNSQEWTVAVLREDHSRGGSTYLHEAVGVGTILRARGPRNHFPLVEAPAYLFVAGGIGITPLLPMIASVQTRPWRLVYGGRTRTAMAFADDLVERYGNRVRIVPEDELGLLSVASLLQGLEPSGTALYCCGPEGLVGALESLHARTRRGTLHVERFSPRELDASQSTGTFQVEARRSGLTVTVDDSTTILDALASAGAPVLSSCREGVCGTCEVFVIDGTPEHRDSILTEDERRTSETMFPCVSRCLSARLVLDI